VGQKRMICFIVFSIVSWASLGNSDGKTSKLEPLTLKHQQAQDGQQVWPFFYICSLLLLTDAEWGWGKSWFQDHCFYSIHYYVSFNIPGMHTLTQRIRTNHNLYVPYHFMRDTTFFLIHWKKITYERHVLCMHECGLCLWKFF
jgi:hypothetical protein